MARIRTVKPELWTDPEFTECSVNTRLLFIALLNFASDYGVLPDKPKQIKMQCLPADTIDVGPLLDELIEHDFLVRRTAPNGDKVLVIRTFAQHQKINRPTEGRWGDPTKWATDSGNPPPETDHDSTTPHGDLSEPSPPEGKGTGRELEGKGSSSSQHNSHLALVEPVDDDDFQQAIEAIVDARCQGRHMNDPRAYRAVVAEEARRDDGRAIRQLLADGDSPDEAARKVIAEALEPEPLAGPKAPWCGPDCPECHGDAWVDTGHGLAPCPERTAS